MDPKFVNVLILGFGFMFLFTAFQTMGNIEKTILESITKDDPNFNGDGYISLAIIYGVFAFSNWLAPSALAKIGPRGSMLLGSLTYCFFVATFLWPRTWLLYSASCILGFGAALIWTGQGTYLSRCSDELTISRNSGIFWALLQASMFFGNLFVYQQFQGKTEIDFETRKLIFGVLTAVSLLGVVFLLALKSQELNNEIKNELEENNGIFIEEFKNSIKLFCTKEMIFLSLTFFYTGLELSFFSGVYSSSIGFTTSFGENAKQLIGLSGICIGAGEIIGGITFGLLATRTNRYGRDPIVILGFLIQIFAFFLIFLNLPNLSPLGSTNTVSYINPPSEFLALICSFLLGAGDACFNTQIYSMLGGVFANKSAAAFAIFKFTQSIAAAISFIYSTKIGLRIQMEILIVFGIIGTAGFCIVEWEMKKRLILDRINFVKNESDEE